MNSSPRHASCRIATWRLHRARCCPKPCRRAELVCRQARGMRRREKNSPPSPAGRRLVEAEHAVHVVRVWRMLIAPAKLVQVVFAVMQQEVPRAAVRSDVGAFSAAGSVVGGCSIDFAARVPPEQHAQRWRQIAQEQKQEPKQRTAQSS